jgi:hypothetical protein
MDIKEALILVDEIPAQLSELGRALNRAQREASRLKERDEHTALKRKQVVRQLTDREGKARFSNEQARDEEVKRRLKNSGAYRRRQVRSKQVQMRKLELELKIEEQQRRFQAALATIKYWTALTARESSSGSK